MLPKPRFRIVTWLLVSAAFVLAALIAVTPVRANVTELALFRRTCGTVNAFIAYDGFSEGRAAFYAAFAVDLNGNGVFGEAGEPIKYIKLAPSGTLELIGATLIFPPVSEGSSISVTAYEVDSAGVAVSPQVAPVQYQCSHRPATSKLPTNSSIVQPSVAIVAKVNVTALTVYSKPTVLSPVLGGLGRGALVNVLAMNQRGDWLQVQVGGQTGWIMWQTQAILLGPYSSLPRLQNAEPFTATPLPVTLTPTP